tara:strand:+ start:17586 stop:18137 length:552 start_codon:yes stop_codon:yes gene_type:complete
MSEKITNDKFKKHISNLIIDKDNYRYVERQKMIMKKIIYILGEENWLEEGYTDSQIKFCRSFLIDYAFIFAINDLITIQNDNGTLKAMPGVKKWSEDYENNFLTAFLKSKETKAISKNILNSDHKKFISSMNKILDYKNDNQLVKRTIDLGKKYDITKDDLLSERGYSLDLEGKILDKIWSNV